MEVRLLRKAVCLYGETHVGFIAVQKEMNRQCRLEGQTVSWSKHVSLYLQSFAVFLLAEHALHYRLSATGGVVNQVFCATDCRSFADVSAKLFSSLALFAWTSIIFGRYGSCLMCRRHISMKEMPQNYEINGTILKKNGYICARCSRR
jgi:hypothetical protein